MDNTITITGNVASEVRFGSGTSEAGRAWQRAEFRLASTRRTRRADGSWGDDGTLFLTVRAWGALADGVRGSLEKGQPVLVSGRLHTDEWTDRNGEVHSRDVLEADAVGHDLCRGRARFAKNIPIPAPPVGAEQGPGGQAPAASPAPFPDAAGAEEAPPEFEGYIELDEGAFAEAAGLETAAR